MTTRSSILAVILLLLGAQGLCPATENGINTVTAENTICDLGHISIKDGPQTCRFRITNNGSAEIEISEALTSCGCTQVQLPEGPIAPGETVNVDVTYDNKEVTEFFDKRIALRFKGMDTTLQLCVRGSTARPERNHFKYATRFLRFEKEVFSIGDVIQGCGASGELKAIYRRHKPARFEFSSSDSGVEVRGDDVVLRHGDTLTVHYKVLTGTQDFGTMRFRISATRKCKNRETADRKGIAVVAISHASRCSDDNCTCSPCMDTECKHMAFGQLKANETKSFEVPVSNTGNADLTIHRIDARGLTGDCSAIVLKPGETRALNLSIEPQRKKKGRYAETITIYSNDPVKPEYCLYYTFDIKATPLFILRPHHPARLDLE